jgi:alkaline phosphatase
MDLLQYRMVKVALLVVLLLNFTTCKGQSYTPSRIFAHNDYVQSVPFYNAHKLRVGFIEADVFLVGNDLMVAHHEREIQAGKTLQYLYLEPLKTEINDNKGSVYKNSSQSLTLMIDLKTDGVSTLNTLVSLLKTFPELTGCRTLQIMISGSVPDPQTWKLYPSFIFFDGRPHIDYSADQLDRVSMISTSFRNHSTWDGMGKLPDADHVKLKSMIEAAHKKGKPMRFWATPDFEEAWAELMKLKLDVIVTDNVTRLSEFMKNNNSQR